MIQPEEIRKKAERLYSKFLLAWLEGEEYFPRLIRADTTPGDDFATAIESVQQLRTHSKEVLGYGYTVQWKEVKSRLHGKNFFPHRITFETQQDFLRYISKSREFERFSIAIGKIRERYPQLLSWIRSHRIKFIDVSEQVDGLLDVIDYFREHPQPGLFARELPLTVDTKFIKQHEGILREWFDLLLPADAILADEHHFERRYGLRYYEEPLLIRFLDPGVQKQFGSPWSECSVALSTLSQMQVEVQRVLIVENKVNLLTLPALKHTVALGGLGNGVVDLRLLSWLQNASIWYWGDIDIDGLLILSRLRKLFPHTVSLMMDKQTIEQLPVSLRQTSERPVEKIPAGLTDSEATAFEICSDQNLRIEQEQIPQSYVIEAFGKAFGRTHENF